MTDADNLLVCHTCGTQFDIPASKPLSNCRICDVCALYFSSVLPKMFTSVKDPRQFVPPTGQKWTSMAELRGKYENKWQQDPEEKGMWSIWTVPKVNARRTNTAKNIVPLTAHFKKKKFAIGQRAFLIETPEGNVLWDLITYLDDKTIEFVSILSFS